MKILVLVLLLLTGCTQAQPELRETKEVQTSIPYSDEELIESANDQIEDEAYYVDSITQQSDSEVWFSLKNKDLNDAKELANLAANDSKLSVGIGVNSKGDVSLTINKLKEQYVFKYEGNELIPDRLVD